jgi:predicted  nucleic acid-binding Zn-ribbon protein
MKAGKIFISSDIGLFSEAYKQLSQQIIVLNVDHDHFNQTYEVTCLHEEFEDLPEGSQLPEYRAVFRSELDGVFLSGFERLTPTIDQRISEVEEQKRKLNDEIQKLREELQEIKRNNVIIPKDSIKHNWNCQYESTIVYEKEYK